MKILLIGSGGREHAIATALKKNENISLFASPGNPGIANIADIVDIDIKNHDEVVKFCTKHFIDLVVIGPEQPLADGLSDSLRANNINVFGPSKNAAQLESSKDYAKNFMLRYNIPTAKFRSFAQENAKDAINYLESSNYPIVIKADGLAAGKGVIIADTAKDATAALTSIFGGEFGSAGDKVVIEEFLIGQEASIFAICDGSDYITLAPSQDHKRIFDGDMGKNTGGMGAYAPADLVTTELLRHIKEDIIDKVIDGMKKDGHPFIGCLYVGLMIDGQSAKVVEFNCRFGDPETQAVLSVFNGDFAGLLYSAANGSIDRTCVTDIADGYATCIVLASDGYPDAYKTGFAISGLNSMPQGAYAFHAGTANKSDKLVTAGGRVLGITATGQSLQESILNAYNAVNLVSFENMYFRKDIGQKGLK